MAYMKKKDAQEILDKLGISYDEDASRDELIEMLEIIGEDVGDSEEIEPEETIEKQVVEKQVVEKPEVKTKAKEVKKDLVSDKPKSSRKDGLIPGQPVTFEQLMRARKNKR